MEGLCELFKKLKLDTDQTKELDFGTADSIIASLQSKQGEGICYWQNCSLLFRTA